MLRDAIVGLYTYQKNLGGEPQCDPENSSDFRLICVLCALAGRNRLEMNLHSEAELKF